jgi:CubicO group peptidase (beta-lactamase class C family)
MITDLFTTRCRVPASLAEVTTIRREREIDPHAVGVEPVAIKRIWGAVERLYHSGIHPAIQVCVRCQGEILIDRAIGHARGNGPDDPPGIPKVLARPDTPFNIFSASKAVTAMVVHWLDQRNLLRLDDPVCEYLPEFARHGKHEITIRHVLTHRAGIPNLPPDCMNLELLEHPDDIVQLLCDAKPTSIPGRQLAYHAITGGFVLGAIVRVVAGKDIRAVLDQHILQPLGFRWMRYGVAERDVEQVALNYVTGPPQFPLVPMALRRALGVAHEDAVRLSNDPRFLVGIIPAGNVVTTANELSRFYQLLLNGGELDGVRIFEPRTIRRATSEQSYLEFDFTLGLPVRYGLGLMLGGGLVSFYGPNTEHAFGHLGFTNIVSWADPARQIAAAVMTSGKPLVYPQIYYAYDILRQIGAAAPAANPRS